MKKLTSILLLLLFVWTVQAQTAREEIRANRYLSANNYYAYPTPTAKQTAAPKGYEPFYISTYMRHGSRYLIDPNDYRFVISASVVSTSAAPTHRDFLYSSTMFRHAVYSASLSL